MGLKIVEPDLSNVDSKFHELYTEKDGKYYLTGVDGMKTEEDITKLSSALAKERNDHKIAREKLAAFNGMNPEEVHAQLDRIPELEAAAAGKIDDAKINEIVENRLKTKVAPLEREKNNLQEKLRETTATVEQYQTRERTRTIHDEVRKAATAAKLLPEAIEDALMLAERVFEIDDQGRVSARDGVGCTPGIDPGTWFGDLQPRRPHWWGTTAGGGASGQGRTGGGGANPWTHENWNMTEQGRIYKENPTKAEQLAKAAGTTLGGTRPAPKR